MGDELTSFKEFMNRREEAAKAYVNGDAEPLAEIATLNSPASFFSPKGDHTEGAAEVLAVYKKDAGAFDSGSETHFEILQMEAAGGLAFWAGFQKASMRMKGKEEAIPMNIRVTEIFRRENGDWKMIHRHADMPEKGG